MDELEQKDHHNVFTYEERERYEKIWSFAKRHFGKDTTITRHGRLQRSTRQNPRGARDSRSQWAGCHSKAFFGENVFANVVLARNSSICNSANEHKRQVGARRDPTHTRSKEIRGKAGGRHHPPTGGVTSAPHSLRSCTKDFFVAHLRVGSSLSKLPKSHFNVICLSCSFRSFHLHSVLQFHSNVHMIHHTNKVITVKISMRALWEGKSSMAALLQTLRFQKSNLD